MADRDADQGRRRAPEESVPLPDLPPEDDATVLRPGRHRLPPVPGPTGAHPADDPVADGPMHVEPVADDSMHVELAHAGPAGDDSAHDEPAGDGPVDDDQVDDGWGDDDTDLDVLRDEDDAGHDLRDDHDPDLVGADAAEQPDGPRVHRARTGGDLVRTGIRGVGQLLVTAGLVVLLFVVYEVWVTDLFSEQKQDQLSQDLREDWDTGGSDDPTVPTLPDGGITEVPLGEGFAFIRIPRFGEDYVKVILEGTDEDELVEGPGHYVDSAMPGEQGNFALAGHRVGKGSPFLDLDQLQAGDPIVIETEDTWYVYRVVGADDPNGIPGQQIVLPSDVSVIAPTPNGPLAGPASGAYLTLTTCHPKFSARQRLIVHAVLDGAPIPKSEAPDGPAALTEG